MFCKGAASDWYMDLIGLRGVLMILVRVRDSGSFVFIVYDGISNKFSLLHLVSV